MKKYVLLMACFSGTVLKSEEPFSLVKTEEKKPQHPFEKRAAKFGQQLRKGPCHEGMPLEVPALFKAIKEGKLEKVKEEFKNEMGGIHGWKENDLTTHNGRRSCTFHDSQGRTALHWAAFYGYLDIVEFLLKEDAEVNCSDAQGWTSLHYATVEGHDKVVSYLLTRGADRNICTKQDARVWILATDRAVQKALERK